MFSGSREPFVELIVGIAVAPFFARFERFDYWVLRCVIVFGRVLVRGTVAAADVAAAFAKPQMHPAAPDLQTVFASVGAGSHVGDLIYVFAVLHSFNRVSKYYAWEGCSSTAIDNAGHGG